MMFVTNDLLSKLKDKVLFLSLYGAGTCSIKCSGYPQFTNSILSSENCFFTVF